jgi:hypothetical protein
MCKIGCVRLKPLPTTKKHDYLCRKLKIADQAKAAVIFQNLLVPAFRRLVIGYSPCRDLKILGVRQQAVLRQARRDGLPG